MNHSSASPQLQLDIQADNVVPVAFLAAFGVGDNPSVARQQFAKFISADHQLELIFSYDNSSQETEQQVATIIRWKGGQPVCEFLRSGYLLPKLCRTSPIYVQRIEHL